MLQLLNTNWFQFLDTTHIAGRLFDWQELIGAFLGASTPILFWIFLQIRERHKKHRDSLDQFQYYLVATINLAVDSERTLRKYVDGSLAQILEGIKALEGTEVYSADLTFIPRFNAEISEWDMNHLLTESGYLNNRLMKIWRMGKELPVIIDDMRDQLGATLSTNKDVVLSEKNSPKVQRDGLYKNLEEFGRVMRDDVLDKNFNAYLNHLTWAYVTATELKKMGIVKWRYKFSPTFMYFRDKSELMKYKLETFDRIDDFIQPKLADTFKSFGVDMELNFSSARLSNKPLENN